MAPGSTTPDKMAVAAANRGHSAASRASSAREAHEDTAPVAPTERGAPTMAAAASTERPRLTVPDRAALHRLLGELAEAVAADAGVRLFSDDGQGTLEEIAGARISGPPSKLARLVGRNRVEERDEQQRSLLVPVPDQRHSLILLTRRGEEDFNAEDRAVARVYARQLADGSSIPDVPAEAAWTRQLDAIQNVAAQLTRLTSMHEVAEAVCIETRRVIEYDNARVYVVSTDRPVLEPIAFRSTDPTYAGETYEGLVVELGEGITGWVAEKGVALLLDDANADPRSLHVPGTDDGLKESMMVVPMRYERRIIGVIVLARIGLAKYNQQDLRLLQVISDQAAVGVENARLLAGRDRLVSELGALLGISQATQLASDEPTLAAVLAHKLAAAASAGACVVSRLDEGSTLLRTLGVHGVVGVENAYDVYNFPLTRRVLRDGVPQLVHSDSPEGDQAEIRLLEQIGARTLLMLPLMAGGRTVGLVELLWLSTKRTVRRSEVDVLRTMANTAAVGLENVRLMEGLRQAADIDQVTGVNNHRYLQERLQQECARAARLHSPLSVLMIDLDGFKAINDRHGHADGDRLLHNVATGLRLAVRANDIVARYGGDEFVVLMPDTDEAQARAVAERIVSGIKKTRHELSSGSEGRVGASAGLAVYPGDGRSPQRLLAAADTAMYAVKRAGGGNVRRAVPDAGSTAKSRPITTLGRR
jgi:diguanylate cyclase (GGDEF)-like protein